MFILYRLFTFGDLYIMEKDAAKKQKQRRTVQIWDDHLCFEPEGRRVGKTTTTNALAMGFKEKGLQVLCVDFDPQGNLSFSLKANNRIEMQNSIYHAIKKELKAVQTVQHTGLCDVIPANILLSGIDMEFTGKGREFLLKDALRPLRALYDVILIDAPPQLGFLTVNAFTASDYLLIPVLSDLYSLQGLLQLGDTCGRCSCAATPI